MKQRNTLLAVLFVLSLFIFGTSTFATFSIVAVDTVTGEIGGAGASCIDNSQIINDLIPNIGAVHTQAWWLQANKDNAHAQMLNGLTPDSLIAWLVANDVEGRPQKRQYGVVTLAGQGASAAHTGSSNSYYAGHRIGPGYAIQGNILLGPEVLDSMEFAYLNTPGRLEDRLMAVLQAAKRPGADSRCLGSNKSAISAFIHVIQPTDGAYLDLVVANTFGSDDPIDSLQVLYDAWLTDTREADANLSTIGVSPTILKADSVSPGSASITVTPLNANGVTPTLGALVSLTNSGDGAISAVVDNGDGTFSATLTASALKGVDTISVAIDAGGSQTALTTRPEVIYYLCGDVDSQGEILTVDDLVYLVAYLFQGGPLPVILESSNIDGVIGPGGPVDVSDLTYLVGYIFQGGPKPVC